MTKETEIPSVDDVKREIAEISILASELIGACQGAGYQIAVIQAALAHVVALLMVHQVAEGLDATRARKKLAELNGPMLKTYDEGLSKVDFIRDAWATVDMLKTPPQGNA